MGVNLILGFFDGVHLGHQEVIKSALDDSESILVTLNESPAKFFGNDVKYILSRKNSVNKIIKAGVSKVVLEDFETIHNYTAKDYLAYLIAQYSPKSIVTGFNYTFGKNKSGNSEFLKNNQQKFGYKYICTSPFSMNGEVVSSTLIKKYLKEGNLHKANKLLGSNFILEGNVISGAQLGRTLGFPTANLEYPKEIVEIPYGAYAVKAGDKLGIMNYGIKPTVNQSYEPIIEVHILNFEGNLYGKNLKIEVIERIREEKKFDSTETLKEQLLKDKEVCLKLLS